MTVLDYREIVAAVEGVPGVAGAGLEADETGGDMLRLDLQAGVDEAAVAITVARVLREQFGIGLDAQGVQIVEDADLSPTSALPIPDQRPAHGLALTRMHLVSSGAEVVATVTVSARGLSSSGRASGVGSLTATQRTVAEATLRAVEGLCRGAVSLQLEQLRVRSDGDVEVDVTLQTPRGSERLAGAAHVRQDPRQAVIRATLSAVRSRVDALLGGASDSPA